MIQKAGIRIIILQICFFPAVLHAHDQSLFTVSSLMPAVVLFLFVVVVSRLSGKTRENSQQSQLAKYTNDMYENSDFPTAVIDSNLKLLAVNRKFTSYFSITADSNFDILSDRHFSQSEALVGYLQQIKKSAATLDSPLFLPLEISFSDNSPGISCNAVYIMIRKLSLSATGQTCFTLTIIDSAYTDALVNDLTQKIAQRDNDLKKLEEIDQLKSEFLATLSHELKTPLVSIKGYLYLMASGKMGPLTEKQEKALRVSLKNTSHLNSVISSILNFARMEAGKLLFDLVNQKLAPHINDIVDSFKPIADNRQITITCEFGENLPLVVIDTELIHRVLINLLENAIKFSPPGSQILISAHRHDNQVKVSIKDHGRGIPADKLEKIKAPFYQADKSDTRPTGGLGLGLAIAEKILVGHGTTLQIESKENVGTVCSFFLKTAPPRP